MSSTKALKVSKTASEFITKVVESSFPLEPPGRISSWDSPVGRWLNGITPTALRSLTGRKPTVFSRGMNAVLPINRNVYLLYCRIIFVPCTRREIVHCMDAVKFFPSERTQVIAVVMLAYSTERHCYEPTSYTERDVYDGSDLHPPATTLFRNAPVTLRTPLDLSVGVGDSPGIHDDKALTRKYERGICE